MACCRTTSLRLGRTTALRSLKGNTIVQGAKAEVPVPDKAASRLRTEGQLQLPLGAKLEARPGPGTMLGSVATGVGSGQRPSSQPNGEQGWGNTTSSDISSCANGPLRAAAAAVAAGAVAFAVVPVMGSPTAEQSLKGGSHMLLKRNRGDAEVAGEPSKRGRPEGNITGKLPVVADGLLRHPSLHTVGSEPGELPPGAL